MNMHVVFCITFGHIYFLGYICKSTFHLIAFYWFIESESFTVYYILLYIMLPCIGAIRYSVIYRFLYNLIAFT